MKIISAKQRADKMFAAYFKKNGASQTLQDILVAMDAAEKAERMFCDVRNAEPLIGFESAYLTTLGYRISSVPIYNGNIGPSGKYDHYINW